MDNKNSAVQGSTAEGVERKMKISRSKSGLPCVGVGGGAYSNTFECRFVIRNGQLAPAIFVRSRGHLACSLDQAVVPVQKNDVLVRISGYLPFDKDNPDICIECYLLIDVISKGLDEYVLLVPVEYDISDDVWNKVKRGIRYHNRDGSYFCVPPQR